MITAGCDVGSLTAKAVIMSDSKILARSVLRTTSRSEESNQKVMGLVLAEAGLRLDDISYIIGTGYGRRQIPFVDEVVSEIVCHGKRTLAYHLGTDGDRCRRLGCQGHPRNR